MRRALREALRAIARGRLVSGASVGVVALTLLLVGAVRLVATNIGRLATTWGAQAQVVIYLDDEVTESRAGEIADLAGRLPGVSGAHLVMPVEAADRLRASLGQDAKLLDGVEPSLLPASIELSLADGAAGIGRLGPDLDRMRKLPGVAEIESMGEWVDRIRALSTLVDDIGFGLLALAGGAAVLVIAAVLGLAVHSRRDEIDILRLCGATDGFIRAPFLVEGLGEGFLGALLALAFLAVGFHVVVPGVSAALGPLATATPPVFLSGFDVVCGLCVGGVLGLVGSAVAVGRHQGR